METEFSDHAPRYAVVEDDEYEWEADPGRRDGDPCVWPRPSLLAFGGERGVPCELLVVAASEAARTFVAATLELCERAAVIVVPKTAPPPGQKASRPYGVEDSRLVGVVDRAASGSGGAVYVATYEADDPEHAALAAKSLLDVFAPATTIVLDSLAPSRFFGSGSEESNVTCLRSLKTSAAKEAICKPLQPPSAIQGFGAAVISLCERRNLPAVVYLTVAEQLHGRPVVTEDALLQYDRVLDAYGGTLRRVEGRKRDFGITRAPFDDRGMYI